MSGIQQGREHAARQARRGRSGRGLTGRSAGALLSALLVFGACAGDNLFSGDADRADGVVSASVNPTTALTGDTIRVRVEATHPAGLRRVGFAALTASGDTVGGAATLVPTGGLVRDTIFTFIVPEGVSPAELVVHGLAVDANGRRVVSTGTRLAIADGTPPHVTILSPGVGATFPHGDSVRVQVRAADIGRVVSLTLEGFAVRRDALQDTRIVERFATRTVVFPQAPATHAPTDTTIARYVLAVPGAVTESVHIVVRATDAAGNIGADTVDIMVGGPRIEIRSPLPGSEVPVDRTLTLRVFAKDIDAGVDRIRINISGARQDSILRDGLGGLDSLSVDIPLATGSVTGELVISATAWNRANVAGQTHAPLRVNVVASAAADTARPRVGVTAVAPGRIEMTDSVRVSVVASDVGSSGLKRVGVVAIVIPDTGSIRQDTIRRDVVYATTQSGTIEVPFAFSLADLYGERSPIALPRRFTLEVHAFALDGAGNCGASVVAVPTVVECEQVPSGGLDYRIARGKTGQTHLVMAVAGYSRALATGSRVADIAVDATRRKLYLSNTAFNRLDVLDLDDRVTFGTVSVGSQPWGMFLANNGSELIVANSGGTNLSIVDLNTRRELPQRRILTPNAVLINVAVSVNESGTQYSYEEIDFSDRPQFVAQDSTGTILYSTAPTNAAPNGTVRYRDPATGEVRMLFTGAAIDGKAEGIAIAHIDSMVVERNLLGTDRVRLFDRVPGTGALIPSTFHPRVQDAVLELAAGGSDVRAYAGKWVRNQVGLSDTTFLAVSGDRGRVAFGDGASGPFGRVMLWEAGARRLSAQQAVVDLLGNAAERVRGLALDRTGGVGTARGVGASYYFSNNVRDAGELRLQGTFSAPGGGAGVALHPLHEYAHESTPYTLSFVPTPDRKVRVVDTFHYCQVGEVTIRDNIVGQVRAELPWAGENAGLLPADPAFLVVRLFAVTDTGRALLLDVRRRDLHRGWAHAPLPGASASLCPL